MGMVTPKINRIIRMTEFDQLRTSITQFNMYMCTDSGKLYYDETPSKRVVYNYVGVKTINDLQYHITPTLNTTYYCWEDNSLWLWVNKWITIWSDYKYPSAYQYSDGGTGYINPLWNGTLDNPVLDNNGLLKDGSVVVRDRNRIIKGRWYIDDGNDNFVISSYLGGGVRILPNGQMSSEGELYIDDGLSEDAYSHIRAEWNVLNHEIYVDYNEKPETDNNPYKNDTHRYLVWHQGNLSIQAILDKVDSKFIYDKLVTQNPKLPDPFEFNVDKLDGKHASDFADKVHTHLAADITDLNTYSLNYWKNRLLNGIQEGITITYNDVTDKFKFSTNNFNITLAQGVTGTGTVTHNGNVTINTTVDPTKHVHNQYLDKNTDIGILVPPLDGSLKIPIDFLPDEVKGGLSYMGEWNPNSGIAPSPNPKRGQFWIANAEGTYDGQLFEPGDWYIWNGTKWEYLENSNSVNSVTTKIGNTTTSFQRGNVTLTLPLLGGISDTYIDYYNPSGPFPASVPKGKIVITDATNHISVTTDAATKLTTEHSIKTDENGHVKISASSLNVSTNGTEDFDLILEMTPTGVSYLKTTLGINPAKYKGVYNASTANGIIPTATLNNGDWYTVSSDYDRVKAGGASAGNRFDLVQKGDILVYKGADGTVPANTGDFVITNNSIVFQPTYTTAATDLAVNNIYSM